MSIELLRALADQALPVSLTAPADVEGLVVLRAAGLVAAVTLTPFEDDERHEIGRCLAITPEGRAALRKGRCEADRGPEPP